MISSAVTAVTEPVAAVGRSRFHRLTVSRVEPLTDDAVAVTFRVPPDLRDAYAYRAGQHLTLRAEVDGHELRRSYSICAPVSAYATSELRVAVKRLAGGAFSGWLHEHLRPGTELDVLTPLGHFGSRAGVPTSGQHVAIAAGSGITPVLSILSTVLEQSPTSSATLLYGNQRGATVMFLDELADLKDRYLQRFQLVHVLSRERQDAELLSGRLDPPRIGRLLDAFVRDEASLDQVAQWYLCGPHAMVTGARDLLAVRGVPAERVHLELFHVEDVAPVRTPEQAVDDARAATVLVTLDGRTSEVAMRSRDESVLAATLRVRPDAPFACTGGVCGTCRARVVEGQVRMDRNYALEPDELARGIVLACQSHPVTDRVSLTYDA